MSEQESKKENTKIEEEQNTKKQQKEKENLEKELSEEDKALKERIDLYCERILEDNIQLAQEALKMLCDEVKSATTSMTSVPKPFKFLMNYFESLQEHYNKITDLNYKKEFADFLSVLAMTSDIGIEQQLGLKYLQEGTLQGYTTWGHEYLSMIAGDIIKAYNKRLIDKQTNFDDLFSIVNQILPQFMDSNADTDAIDLLIEIDKLEQIIDFINDRNFQKILLYLISQASYSVNTIEMNKTLNIAYKMCLKQSKHIEALRMAIKMNNKQLIQNVFSQCTDKLILKQMAFILARQRVLIDFEDEELKLIQSNQKIVKYYQQLATDLNVLEPKKPDDVYKSYLDNKKAPIDSALQNLADTYVNAFVHVGIGQDYLMLNSERDAWIHRVKNEGQVAAVASIGLTCLWDLEKGFEKITEYLELTDGYAKQGAYFAIGLYNMGITDENDPAKALFEDAISGNDQHSKLGSILGLGLAYAGSAREDVAALLIDFISDVNINVEISAFAALSLGLVMAGTCHSSADEILSTLSERKENQLDQSLARFFSVGLGLIFLGRQDDCEIILESLAIVEHPIRKYTENLIKGCAYIGSGNVLQIQQLVHQLFEKCSGTNAAYQEQALLAIALIASSEEVGNEMIHRQLNHILQHGSIELKRAVPLALSILNLSNPRIQVQDLLQKLAHDSDLELATRAILALGFIAVGTNNSRVAGILRSLVSYYSHEKFNNYLLCIRIAQGLVHTGKGLVTIQPYYSERFLLSITAISGIITLMNACLDMEHLILDKHHYFLYYLGLAITPRMLFSVDEDLENLQLNIRVGQGVDVVGQVGQPKRITGFQTYQSPILLRFGDRAELANEEYITLEDGIIMENVIIVKKNPDYEEEMAK